MKFEWNQYAEATSMRKRARKEFHEFYMPPDLGELEGVRPKSYDLSAAAATKPVITTMTIVLKAKVYNFLTPKTITRLETILGSRHTYVILSY